MPRIESPATPQNVLSGGDGFELDLLPSVDGAGLFCFEARSGAYQRYAPKYFGVAKLMDIEPARCFMILTAIAPGTCRALGPLFTMTVRHVQNYHAISAGTLSGNFTTAGEQAPHPEPGESSGVPEPNCPPDFLHPQLS